MSVITIWSVAEVVPIRLQLAPSGAASDLELLVLEAVGTGVDDVAALAAYFGIPRRLMVDLVGDLWRAQRVTIAFGDASERVEITRAGRESVDAAARGAEYESAMRTPHVERVLLDTLSGQLLPFGGSRSRIRDQRVVVPRQPDDPDARNLLPEELATAVARELRRRGDSEDRVGAQRVVSARLAPAPSGGDADSRYLPLDVDVTHRTDGGVEIRLPESVWPLEVQRRTVERIQRLVDDAPASGFARMLAGAAGTQLVDAPPLDKRLAQLLATTDTLSATPVANRQAAQDRVAARFHALAQHVEDTVRREVGVRLVHTKGEHERTITTLVEQAERQLILALPWINYEELTKYQQGLSEAVTRGVGVTVLWGINRDEKSLDHRVLALFDDVQRQAQRVDRGGFLHVDREQSSHIHAKMVASDDRAALITSRNYFSASDHFEIGVLLEAPDGHRAPLIEDISTWAYNTTPNLAHARHLLRDPAMFGDRADGGRWAPPPVPRVELAQLTDPECPPEVLRLWERGWCEAVEALGEDAVRSAPVGYLVTDGLHQSRLSTALRDATRRVIVASAGLSHRVLTKAFIQQIEGCLARGVHVSLYYGEAKLLEDLQVVTALQDLARNTTVGRLDIVHRAKSHAKVLVSDNEVIIGSYNYLSFDAAYGAGRRSQRGEVSVRLTDGELAEMVAKLLSTTHSRGASRPLSPTVRDAGFGPARLAGAVIAMLDQGVSVDAAEIARTVGDVESYAAVRDELRATNATVDRQMRLDAAVVAGAQGALHEAALLQLMGRAWERADLAVAHAVRAAVQQAAPRPRTALTAAAGALALDAPDADELFAAITRDPECLPYERECILILRMAASLRDGNAVRANSGLPDAVELPELTRWQDAALNRVVGRGALPADLARAMRTPDRDESEELWTRMAPLIDRLAKWKPNHIESERTAQYLVKEPLAKLRAISLDRDLPALVEWVSTNRGNTDGAWLDTQVQRAGVRIRIESTRRRYMLQITKVLLISARTLVAQSMSGTDTISLDAAELEELTELARLSSELLSVLPETVELAAARTVLQDLTAGLGGRTP